MEFEFDQAKSESNKIKHGIDFVEAQLLWADQHRVILTARTDPELRFILIAKQSDKHWSAVFTVREGRTRIISVRRSRDEEQDIYSFGARV